MGEPLTFTVPVNDHVGTLSMNRRGHWAKDDDSRAWWRQMGFVHGRRLRMAGALLNPPVRIVVGIHWPDRRRRDPANYTLTAKALVDGLVDAGLVKDDSDRYVVGPDLRRIPMQDRGFPLYLSCIIYETDLATEVPRLLLDPPAFREGWNRP